MGGVGERFPGRGHKLQIEWGWEWHDELGKEKYVFLWVQEQALKGLSNV